MATEVAPDGVVLLIGDLGSGKTVLTQGIARGLGIDPEEVQSPTFTLMREHEGMREHEAMREHGGMPQHPVAASRLIHIDLYRLEPAETADLGLEEVLGEAAVKVVEWADRLPHPPPADLILRLARGDTANERTVQERNRGTLVEPTDARALRRG